MAMNKLFKQFVAFAIVAVMLCGLIPVSAMAVEHDHDHQRYRPLLQQRRSD